MAINQVILLIHTQHIHVGLSSDPIQSSTGEGTAIECDIGKLLHLGKDLHSLHRDDKYRILKRVLAHQHIHALAGPFRHF